VSLKAQNNEDMKAAMRAKAADRLKTVRLLLAAIKQREVDERIELSDADVVGVIDKMLKQRRESIQQFEKAGRQDLVAAEQAEVDVLTEYMPKALSESEVQAIIAEAIQATGAKGPKDIGAVMTAIRSKLAGRADLGRVSQLVKAKLASA
jgi:uncharacterized protein YqeY